MNLWTESVSDWVRCGPDTLKVHWFSQCLYMHFLDCMQRYWLIHWLWLTDTSQPVESKPRWMCYLHILSCSQILQQHLSVLEELISRVILIKVGGGRRKEITDVRKNSPSCSSRTLLENPFLICKCSAWGSHERRICLVCSLQNLPSTPVTLNTTLT